MSDYTPWWLEAEEGVTLLAGAAITGGNLVKVGAANMTVIPTAAITDDNSIGVAATDIANAAEGLIFLFGPVHRLVAAGAITRGQHVGPGAVAGTVSTLAAAATPTAAETNANARGRVGIALESAADTAICRVMTVR